MEPTRNEQINSLIEKSSHILLMASTPHTIDGLASVLALSNYLTKKNKKHDVVASSIDFPEKHLFLPGIKSIVDKISTSNKFLINLDVSRVKVKEFSYDVKNNFLTISITPESGRFSSNDVVSGPVSWDYDLVLVVDSQGLEMLGSLYEEYRECFYKTPIVSFDYRVGHEAYATINAVDFSAVCVSEVVYEYLIGIGAEYFDKDICTLLLTGLMGATHGFRGDVVTPRSLRIGSDLMAHGADKSLIIRELYQRKSVEFLKLCGIVLSRLSQDESFGLAYSYLVSDDLNGKNVRMSELVDIIDEFLSVVPDVSVILFSFPLSGLSSRHMIKFFARDAGRVLAVFNPKRHGSLWVIDFVDGDVLGNQKKIIEHLKNKFA